VPEDGKVLIGRVFDDRYEVIKKLGSGGMADVFLAQDRLLGRQVALKVLSSRYANDEQFIERFRREASSAASLNHPNIVQIYDRGEAEGTYYIAMEYLEGRSLKEIILKYAPLSPDLVVSVSVQILEALRFAHRRDVIHRDIKPQNMIIDNEGRVKVTDFGIARAGSASTMTEAGSILGTAHYLSPEQAQGRPVEAASDLYSLGVLMYEMATGRLPYDGDNPVTIAMQHVHDSPTPPRSIATDLPENLESVILRALGKRPTDRYLTAQAFLDDLKRVQEGRDVTAPAAFMEDATKVMSPAAAAASLAQQTQVRQRVPSEIGSVPMYPQEPPRRHNAWPWILVLILILALAGGAYAIFSAWGTGSSADTAVVPSLVGLTEAQAKQKVEDAGLKFKNAGTQPSADVSAGNVVRQEPEDGTKKDKGTTISVWISSGKGRVTVPNVVGKTQVDATQQLMALGLKVKATSEANKDKPAGTVLRQNPAGEKQADAGATVTIVVATQTNTVSVPSVLTMNQAAAVSLLEGMNLKVIVEPIDSTETGGTVVDQNPKSSTEVQPQSTVTIYVSNAPLPTTVKVPAVAGLTRAQAVAKLALFGLKASITYEETPDVPPNIVISQDPTAGVEVQKNSTVNILVAKEPPSTTTTTVPPDTTTTTAPPSTDTTAF
jgi:beta-lactam-binding protein with PASTA domain/predicted Ser/Thr protein kinase